MNPSEKHESGANMFMEVGLSMQQFKVFLCTYHVQFQLERMFGTIQHEDDNGIYIQTLFCAKTEKSSTIYV